MNVALEFSVSLSRYEPRLLSSSSTHICSCICTCICICTCTTHIVLPLAATRPWRPSAVASVSPPTDTRQRWVGRACVGADQQLHIDPTHTFQIEPRALETKHTHRTRNHRLRRQKKESTKAHWHFKVSSRPKTFVLTVRPPGGPGSPSFPYQFSLG